jgi:CBS domain containing-hemolysin-like protein
MATELLLIVSIVGFLILVNAFYVAAEFGVVSARRSRIHELAVQRNWLAGLLLPVVQDAAALDRYVATCQIGITLSSLVLGAYGQATLATMLTPLAEGWGGLQPLVAESTAAMIVLIALTALQVVFGELIPKSLALRNPTVFALYTALPMRWSQWLFHWFIAVLNGSGVLVLRSIGMAQHGHRHVHSPEELELLIAESRDGGLLEPDEQRRLHQALRLGLRRARHLMVPRASIEAIDVQWSAERVLEAVLDTPFSRLPVYDGSLDQVVGILHTRDLVMARVQRRRLDALRALIRPALIVPEMMPANDVLRLLRERRTHLALVIDEFGTVEGLLTLEDVLSELLGEVGDEFHAAGGEPERLPDGRIRMPGHLPLDEAQRWLGSGWVSDANTIAGHVMQMLGRLPAEGDRIRLDGIEIEVERLHGRVPATLLATPRRVRTEDPHG